MPKTSSKKSISNKQIDYFMKSEYVSNKSQYSELIINNVTKLYIKVLVIFTHTEINGHFENVF